jgi:hypothetical protein
VLSVSINNREEQQQQQAEEEKGKKIRHVEV